MTDNPMNEALERASEAVKQTVYNYPQHVRQQVSNCSYIAARAAILAFLRSAPVSEGVSRAGLDAYHTGSHVDNIFHAMTTKLADEIEGMSNGQ